MTTRFISETELFDCDYVIIRSDGSFYHFEDGEIIIYGDVREAYQDSKTFKDAKMISCTRLSRKQRKELRKNIRTFAHEKK